MQNYGFSARLAYCTNIKVCIIDTERWIIGWLAATNIFDDPENLVQFSTSCRLDGIEWKSNSSKHREWKCIDSNSSCEIAMESHLDSNAFNCYVRCVHTAQCATRFNVIILFSACFCAIFQQFFVGVRFFRAELRRLTAAPAFGCNFSLVSEPVRAGGKQKQWNRYYVRP